MLLISYCRLLALFAEVWGPREGQMTCVPGQSVYTDTKKQKALLQRLESGRSSSLLACTSAGSANPSFPQWTPLQMERHWAELTPNIAGQAGLGR